MRIIPYQIEMKETLIMLWEEASRMAHPFIDESKRALEKYQIETFLLNKMNTYVMEDSGDIFGFISLAGSVIVGLFVACHKQNQGIGTALINHVSLHDSRLSVEVFEKNPRAIRFYESLGFKFKRAFENKLYSEKIVIMERVLAIKVNEISKQVKSKKVLNRVTFEIYKKDVFGLIGENGAGKTTLLKMMLNLTHASSGKIVFNNARYSGVIDTPSFYNHLSAYDNLMIISRYTGNENPLNVIEALKTVNLFKSRGIKVGRYSLGMKQRLAIAQCIVSDSDVIVLDEPTNGLDPEGIFELRLLINHLVNDFGKTFIISTHLLSEAQIMCNRVAFISDGHVVKVTSRASINRYGSMENAYFGLIGRRNESTIS